MQVVTEPQRRFKALNEYFDKIYILTIPRNEARRSFLDQHLEGLDFKYFYGADGQKLKLDEMERKGEFNYQQSKKNYSNTLKKLSFAHLERELHLNEVACALSHKMMYQDIIDNKLKNALILEDDVAIESENLSFSDQILKELPKDWELFYTGYIPTMLTENFGDQVKARRTLITNLYQAGVRFGKIKERYLGYAKPMSKHMMKGGSYWGTHAYAITNQAAKKLIQLQSPLTWVADHLLAHASTSGTLNVYASTPELFVQNRINFQSSIWS